MRLCVLLLLSALILVAPLAPLCAADKADAPNPALLVERLGSSDFAERLDATRALDALGEPAVAALKTGLHSDDMEVRRRCEELLAKIDRRVQSARVLAAKRVQLAYKDTPLSEAVADFSRKTAYTLELAGDQSKLAGRRVTLDTNGAVTFWEALDKFCEAAGVIEIGLAQTPADSPKPGTPEEQLVQLRLQQQQMLMGRGGFYNPYGPQPQVDPSKVILVDGKLPVLPTARSSALRVRLLPGHVSVAAEPGGAGEKTLPLEVVPEPGLPWLGMVSVRIDRAIDEHGQTLVQPALFISQSIDPYNPYVNNVQVFGGNLVSYGGMGVAAAHPTHAPVRLRMGDRPAKLVKELEGTVTCQVQSPVEPLITVDNVLKAKDVTAEGPDGGSLKVTDVKREGNGQVRVKVVVQPPAQDVFDGAVLGGRAVRINRAVLRLRAGMADYAPPAAAGTLELRDERGLAFQAAVVGQQAQGVPGGVAVAEQELLFTPNPNQGAPAKLVYMGRRVMTVEAPFTLKDVPLP